MSICIWIRNGMRHRNENLFICCDTWPPAATQSSSTLKHLTSDTWEKNVQKSVFFYFFKGKKWGPLKTASLVVCRGVEAFINYLICISLDFFQCTLTETIIVLVCVSHCHQSMGWSFWLWFRFRFRFRFWLWLWLFAIVVGQVLWVR